jgi:hypothetical protein
LFKEILVKQVLQVLMEHKGRLVLSVELKEYKGLKEIKVLKELREVPKELKVQ